jgi:hypothetical protein
VLDLGAPARVHYKTDDRMSIHAGTVRTGADGDVDAGGDCECTGRVPGAALSGCRADFYNYFQHGIDVLLSGDHVVKKIILHTNIVRAALVRCGGG